MRSCPLAAKWCKKGLLVVLGLTVSQKEITFPLKKKNSAEYCVFPWHLELLSACFFHEVSYPEGEHVENSRAKKWKEPKYWWFYGLHPAEQPWNCSTSEVVEMKYIWRHHFNLGHLGVEVFFFLFAAQSIITNVFSLLSEQGRKFSQMINGTLLVQ